MHCVDFSPSGLDIAAAGESGRVKVNDFYFELLLRSRTNNRFVWEHQKLKHCIDFKVFNIRERKVRLEIKGNGMPPYPVLVCRFSYDERQAETTFKLNSLTSFIAVQNFKYFSNGMIFDQ